MLGVHPYTADRSPDRYTQDANHQRKYGEIDGNFLGFVRMTELMEDQGDAGKNLFLSEYGFPTSDTAWVNAVPDARRALYLKRAHELARDVPNVEGVSWYAYHPNSNDSPEWAIVDENFNPSLTFRALKQATGAEASTVKLSIDLPESVPGSAYPIEPETIGLRNSEITRWELYVDGALVGEQAAAPIDWDPRGAEAGVHEVMVAAYTTEGSVWHSNIAKTDVAQNYLLERLDRLLRLL